MNWVDLAIIAVVVLSAAIGWMRGFVREVLGIASWALAAYIAFTWYPSVEPFVLTYLPNPDFAQPVAIGGVFLIALIVLSVIASMIGRLARDSALSAVDGTLGIAFGVARGAIILFCAYIAGGTLVPADRWPPVVQDARTLPYIYGGAVWLTRLVPEQYKLAPPPAPPAGRETRAADLLQANPSGSALSQATHN